MSRLGDLLGRWAAASPARVFPVAGAGARRRVQDLRLGREIELVDTPRHADVLLLAGRIPPAWLKPAARVHDQMPRPRGVVRWGAPGVDRLFPAAETVPTGDRPDGEAAATVVRLHRELTTGARASSPLVQPDHPPAPWRGVGPHGQGGEGMMGGRPYGRPMAMREEARDGLALDRIRVPVGPFFAPFPPGLAFHAGLQGDVLQEVEVEPNPFHAIADAVPPPAWATAKTIAEIEEARARHHLRWLADALRTAGLAALGTRVLRTAVAAERPDPAAIRRLGARLERFRALDLFGRVGRIEGGRAETFGGPVARAAGIERDFRSDDAAYRALGFAPAIRPGGDVRARWLVRIEEAATAAEIAGRAGDREPDGPVEPFTAAWAPDTLADALTGLEWGDAVATIVSLDLDLEADAKPVLAEASA